MMQATPVMQVTPSYGRYNARACFPSSLHVSIYASFAYTLLWYRNNFYIDYLVFVASATKKKKSIGTYTYKNETKKVM